MGQLLDAAALMEVRAHPRFREAVEQFARDRLAQFRALDPASRWAISDLGRSTLSRASVVLDRTAEGLTARSLLDAARRLDICSRARALAYLDGAQARGLLRIPIGPAHWTDRKVQLSPALVSMVEDNARNLLAAVNRLGAGDGGEVRPEEVQRLLGVMAGLPRQDPAVLSRLPTAIRRFMEHDGGLRVLDELVARQAPGRGRLLEKVPLNRLSLARASGTSRAQLSRLLAAAEREGLIVRERELDVAPSFSDAVELRFALIFRLAQVAAASGA